MPKLLLGPLGPLLISATILLLVVLPQRQETTPAIPPAAGAHLACSLTRVIDGDTIDVACNGSSHRIRIWGIDAPERAQAPWGALATRRLREFLGNGELRISVEGQDIYDRVLARVSAPELPDTGLSLVREGYASVRTRYVSDPDYREARSAAKRERLGIWSQPGAQQRPWEWRRLNSSQ